MRKTGVSPFVHMVQEASQPLLGCICLRFPSIATDSSEHMVQQDKSDEGADC